MKCSWNTIDLGWRFGSIDSMAKEAIQIANMLDTQCTFEFNSVTIAVDKYSEWERVCELALKAVQDGKSYVSIND